LLLAGFRKIRKKVETEKKKNKIGKIKRQLNNKAPRPKVKPAWDAS